MSQTTFLRQEIDQFDKPYRTHLINSLTGFKSVALVGTQDAQGKTNLSPFSQIIHVGANPPLLGILFRPHTVPRHTLENIEATRAFTVNHIREEFVAQAHQTSARWDVSEFEACHLTPEYTAQVAAPYVREAHISIGLQWVERADIAANGTILIIGEMMEIRLPSHALHPDGFVDLEAAGTLTCSNLDAYHKTEKIARYSYAKPGEPLREL